MGKGRALRVLLVFSRSDDSSNRLMALQALQSLGPAVEIFCVVPQLGPICRHINPEHVFVEGPASGVASWFRGSPLSRWVKTVRPDLVYTEGDEATLLLGRLGRLSVPLVVHRHASPLLVSASSTRAIDAAVAGWAGPVRRLNMQVVLQRFVEKPAYLEAILGDLFPSRFSEKGGPALGDQRCTDPVYAPWVNHHNPLTQFDWEGHGVTSKYAIFFTPRSGSTYLGSLLGQLGLSEPIEFLSPGFMTWYNEANGPFPNFESYWSRVVGTSSANGFFGTEILWEHLEWTHNLADIERLFPVGDTRFVFLRRRRLVNQVHSFVTAKVTGTWHRFVDGQVVEQAPDLEESSDELIFDYIRQFIATENRLQAFMKRQGIRPFILYYEDLLSDPLDTLFALTTHLGLPLAVAADLVPQIQARTVKPYSLDATLNRFSFYDRHREFIDEFRKHRDGITVEQFDEIRREFQGRPTIKTALDAPWPAMVG